MSQDAGTGERVYDLLKRELLMGKFNAHSRLDFAELAMIYDVSTTPVREAAMRLLGEGLLEVHPKAGARPAQLTEYRLRSLLDIHARLVQLALDRSSRSIEPLPPSPRSASNEQRTRELFRTVARGSGNPELIDLLERLGDKLTPFRLREERVIQGVATELDTLYAALSTPDTLRRGIRLYHRRRIASVERLVWVTSTDQQGTDPRQ